MHYTLKSLGIRNNKFMLTLLDPDLADVSPFDPNLNRVMKQKILIEVKNNIWYFLREVVRIPTYKLNRDKLALLFFLNQSNNLIPIITRNPGK